jgi:hypothetical protein
MKTCRESLNKLKNLCNQLSDRDEQLKINASTLWVILDKIEDVKDSLSDIEIVNSFSRDSMGVAIETLSDISELVLDRGCKRVKENE